MIERGTCPKSLMEGSKGSQELGRSLTMCVLPCFWSVPLVGSPALPFIDQGGAGVTDGRKRKIPKESKVLRGSRVFLFPCACPANMADRVRDGVFADPYRAVSWPLLASGCVPSYADGWCGVPESRAVTPQGVIGEVTIRPSL